MRLHCMFFFFLKAGDQIKFSMGKMIRLRSYQRWIHMASFASGCAVSSDMLAVFAARFTCQSKEEQTLVNMRERVAWLLSRHPVENGESKRLPQPRRYFSAMRLSL